MPGSFEWSGEDLPSQLSNLGTPTAVFRFDGAEYTRLPNVDWTSIQWRAGDEIPIAALKYLMDDTAIAWGWPNQFDQVWPTSAAGPYVVQPDDRICILAWTPHGEPLILFDGHAQIPQADVSQQAQTVTFRAVGVAARSWDLPITTRVQRPGHQATTAGSPLVVSLPTRFNPTDSHGLSKPNCAVTPDESSGATAYPVFFDPAIVRDPEVRRYWTLSGAVRYLLALWNAEEYVENPDFGPLDDLLKARTPKEGYETYDPDDPSTYDAADITIRDYDATNKTWPDVLGDLLAYHGFGFGFRLELDADGLPRNWLDIYRIDAGAKRAPKVVWLDQPGSAIDPARNSVTSISLARDMSQVVNAFRIETPPRRVEVSVVLAPGYSPASGDEAEATRKTFRKDALAAAGVTSAQRRKYRWYVADEAGDGHWNGSSFVTNTALDLSDVFSPLDSGEQAYVERLRPGKAKLNSVDSAGKKRKAVLAYSQDYAGAYPALWDGSGTWKTIVGGWELLDDRLGIEVTAEDPEQWNVAKGKGELRGVTWQANPPSGKRFWLRLTTVIDEDVMLDAFADKRLASPTKFERARRIDGRDHYEMLTVHSSSEFYDGDDGLPQVIRDDTDRATAHAESLRAAHEFPRLAGSLGFPYLTNAYQVGDLIEQVAGRGVSLQVNAGIGQGEAKTFPVVVGVRWLQSETGQRTELAIQDHRAEVARA